VAGGVEDCSLLVHIDAETERVRADEAGLMEGSDQRVCESLDGAHTTRTYLRLLPPCGGGNMEQLRAWYDSPEYAPARGIARNALRRRLLFVEGVDR
jgi:hypothetical protein